MKLYSYKVRLYPNQAFCYRQIYSTQIVYTENLSVIDLGKDELYNCRASLVYSSI